MEGKSIFISSCSRRQWARRRSQTRASVVPGQLMIALLVLVVAFGAFVAGHGGV